ncbi:MAG: Phage shock protein suppresses sigma54-dependent transcription [Ilumatobacteraceae bacterium]|nr:Phage shock protein suppresses sigma54-dependent transcription [Ilumatobacteraceae bacterium]
MTKLLKRWWAYLTAGANQKFNENADPKIQLEQAITEAQDQHRRLKEHAANVIAQQHLTEQQLDRQLEQLEKLNTNARQAVKMADTAAKSGDTAKATEYTRAAETIATQLISVESQIADLKEQHYAATQAADQAKSAVTTNGQVLQQKLAEKQKLLSQLEQAKMQEQMNKAMASLSETVGQEVPTLNEVRDKIEQRYAKAKGMSELQETSVETRMVEIEAAAQNFEAQARLDEIRSQMGITTGAPAVEAPAAPETATATATAPATDPPAEPQASPGT